MKTLCLALALIFGVQALAQSSIHEGPTSNTELMWDAINASRWTEAIKLVTDHPELLKETNMRNETPLHVALWFANKDIAKTFLDKSHDQLMSRDEQGHTPLHIAIMSQNSDLILEILKLEPRAASVANDEHRYALHLAVMGQSRIRPDVVRAIADAFPDAVGMADDDERTPLTWAHMLFNYELTLYFVSIMPADKIDFKAMPELEAVFSDEPAGVTHDAGTKNRVVQALMRLDEQSHTLIDLNDFNWVLFFRALLARPTDSKISRDLVLPNSQVIILESYVSLIANYTGVVTALSAEFRGEDAQEILNLYETFLVELISKSITAKPFTAETPSMVHVIYAYRKNIDKTKDTFRSQKLKTLIERLQKEPDLTSGITQLEALYQSRDYTLISAGFRSYWEAALKH